MKKTLCGRIGMIGLSVLCAGLVEARAAQSTGVPDEQDAVPEAVPQRVVEVAAEPLPAASREEEGQLRIEVKVVHGNRCMEPEFLIKKKEILDGRIRYQLLGFDRELKHCPQVYLPVTRNVVLDVLSVQEAKAVEQVEVNGTRLQLHP